MDVLALAQTIYYFTASTAIVVFGVLGAIVVYHLIYIAKRLRHISKNLDHLSGNLNDASGDIKERVEEIIERLSALPVLSYFLKRDRKPESRVSRANLKNKR